MVLWTSSPSKFGLGVTLPSTRHTQCQVTFRKSGNHNIREIHKSTSNINIQYDQFNSTRDALKHIRSSDVSCIMEKLTTQSLVVKYIWEFVDGRFINQWSNVISHLPRNIFNFTIRYLSNTLANGTNAIKWGITNSYTCIFCDQQQTLGHVIGGCETELLESRCNWHHDWILLNIYKTVKSQGLQAFVNIEGYPNPSIITGDEQRPDFAFVEDDNLLLLELTVGFETNIKKNFNRKAKRYQQLLAKLSNKYKVYYVNLSLGAIGIIGKDSLIMTAMGNFDLSKETLNFIVNRTINVCIRTTYYIFCMRNKEWENPELLNW